MPEVLLGEIVDFVGGSYSGPREMRVRGVATLDAATRDQISFFANRVYADQVESSSACAIFVASAHEGDDPRFIRVEDPYFAMSRVVAQWFASRPAPRGLSPRAEIASSAVIGSGVAIGAFTTIGEGVIIRDGAIIYPNVTIGDGSTIGEGTIIYPQVSVYERSAIGRRCIIHSGAVIGSDGYGFATHGGKHHKIPQVGIVRIEDDVEVGAGTTIDRAALGETVIGEGTKIDNLVQIGHNVRIGKHCLLVAQVGIAGSAEIGDYVVIAGQSGVAGHLKVGSYAQIAAKTAVFHDVAPNTKVIGVPAGPFRESVRRDVWIKRLPELARRIAALEKNPSGDE